MDEQEAVERKPQLVVLSNEPLNLRAMSRLFESSQEPQSALPSFQSVLERISGELSLGIRKGLTIRRLKERFVKVDDWTQLPGWIYIDPEKNVAFSFQKSFLFYVKKQGREAYRQLALRGIPASIARFPDLNTEILSILLGDNF